MNKYTLVGTVNLFLGGLEIILSITGIALVIPRLTELYSEVIETPPSFASGYFVFGLIALMGVANLLVSSKLFSKAEKLKDKYLKYGLVLIVATFILLGVFMIISNLPMSLWMYNLNSEL